MSKKITKVIRLQIPAGKANPAPPIGPALGAAGVNIMGFCKEFNAKTQELSGKILPTIITVYGDKTFTFETKQPPVAEFIKEELKLEKGSGTPNREKIGKLTKSQAKKIAEGKFKDMGAVTIEAAMRCVAGTARSMGVELVDG